MKTVSGAAAEVEIERPERLVPGQDHVQQQRRGDARQRHRGEHVDELAAHGRPIHPRRFQYVPGNFLEVGEEHPHHNRQVAAAENNDQAAAAIEQAEGAVEQINRHQYPDRRHHLCPAAASTAGRRACASSERMPSTRRYIDIIVTADLWNVLASKYGVTDETGVKKIVFSDGIVEALGECSVYAEKKDPVAPTIADRIANAENY